jgi:hypothetical protein
MKLSSSRGALHAHVRVMSALPQKQTLELSRVTSALCQKRTCQLLRLYVDLLLNNNR